MQKATDINSVLVANRGEIACRIIRTVKAMGLRAVAVYADADAQALHVQFADDAVHIGASNAADSYLNIPAVLAAAASANVDAIHPGYGFLSENAGFAAAVVAAGIVFIGPSVKAIEIMGDKAQAKRHLADSDVPCIAGYAGSDQSDQCFQAAAQKIGFPVMIKAAAGGGGRGMRLVHTPNELLRGLALARSEALNAFGSDVLILEQALLRARHVEVQIFADEFGAMVHLGERDCSVQRRHQKVIEEAPCPVMTPELRVRMGEAACSVARSVNYVGAGTVEFLLDSNGAFYFLEMNTRLQVEHPVTEMVTGIDLVETQIRVASGERLPFSQQDIALTGHAIEVRLCAEDPSQNFLPSTGPILGWFAPSSAGVRIDTGIGPGAEVSTFYDSMVAKVIAHGATRDQARQRLSAALKQLALFGPNTNRDFLLAALSQPDFGTGAATTAFIEESFGNTGYAPLALSTREVALGAGLLHACALRATLATSIDVSEELVDWSSSASLATHFQFDLTGEIEHVVVMPKARANYTVVVRGETLSIELLSLHENVARVSVDGRIVNCKLLAHDARRIYIATAERTYRLDNLTGVPLSSVQAVGGGSVVAPMHGQLLDVRVEVGAEVEVGECVAVLEAMKMQHELLAEVSGIVSARYIDTGTQVAAGECILMITADESK